MAVFEEAIRISVRGELSSLFFESSFCQVVWNSSYKVGCGMTLCPNGIYFYACHYYRA